MLVGAEGFHILNLDVCGGKPDIQEHAKVCLACVDCAMPMPRVLLVRWWHWLALSSIALSHVDTFVLIPFSHGNSGHSRRHTSGCQCPYSNTQHAPIPQRLRPHRLGKHLSPAVHEPTAVDTTVVATEGNARWLIIQPATFFDLRAVARLLVEEFYGMGLFSPAQRLVELNRLQDNFHSYEEDADRHLMLIATTVKDGSLVGFVDIDGREKKPGQSELKVSCRRHGLNVRVRRTAVEEVRYPL